MAIRGVDLNDAPPPLPPPRLVPISGPVDPNLHFRESMRREKYAAGSPDTDSLGHSFKRRDLSFRSDLSDDGYHSLDSVRSSGFPSPFGHHTMNNYRPNGDSIDHSMLDKLNRPARRSALSASVNDLPGPRAPHHAKLTTLSLPHRTRQPFLDSAYTRSPGAMSATSPINAPFGHPGRGSIDHRSPLGTDGSDYDRSPLPRTHRMRCGPGPDDGMQSALGGYEVREDDADFPMEETTRMGSLAIGDQWKERDWDRDRERDRDRDRDRERERERERECYQPGQKRRASSPPSDDAALANDMLRRRDGGLMSRGSPTPRLLVIPQNSLSSVSSVSRSGSYASNLTASSITSMGSFGRRSPNGLSPGGLSPTDAMGCSSPYPPPSLSASPHPSIGRSLGAPSPHHRTPIEQPLPAQVTRTAASPRKLAEIPKSHSSLAAKLKGPHMCECCPKKPKKFETEEELRAHEAEKQYGCSFCGNRFKNKNEAERHQNSLHVRRHSWSCSALTAYERAFHDSTAKPGEADVCGYCGEEFPRSGQSQGAACVSEQDWEDRIRHLQDMHKFRECNSSKKFYRADHFRQHLKHSHAGTSGKWTNMLENACMLEEEPPVPTR
ncbi:hypothetical protein C8A00DRAFT_45129 [Chaetomidium leptoderma]|uniref:C2H2-type domain-containing protein n=1 Tax=Chaetomidium leptoderma TaxID=669021 RepID=A0AAN6VHR5_9PEZI|nr:hypothetical protein C8A00DRAFT_45129 [Chaetomidium leptoderma]